MYKILVLTSEVDLFEDVEESLKKDEEVEIILFQHSLKLINHFLTYYAPLVILDIDFLKNEILEMIQVLKNIHPNTKIILILSPENMPICLTALSQGVVSYQVKPISSSNAAAIISSILHSTIDH